MLAHPGTVDDTCRDCRAAIDNCLTEVGITSDRPERFRGNDHAMGMRGYSKDLVRWDVMDVLAASCRPGVVAELERRLIASYKHLYRYGSRVPCMPDRGCLNNLPGGEMAGRKSPPWFLYVI